MAAYYDIRRENVRELRLRAMMTQNKLAKAAGVSKQTITRMEDEDGAHTPHLETIQKVADALGADTDALVIYHTLDNEQRIGEAQREWEERSEGANDSGNRGA